MSVSMTAHLPIAQNDVAEVINEGHDIKLLRASTKDKGGMATSSSSLEVKAFPLEFAPFDRTDFQKVAWKDVVDIIVCIEMKGRNPKKLQAKYGILEYSDIEYDITHIVPDGAFANTHLYILIGAVKKS